MRQQCRRAHEIVAPVIQGKYRRSVRTAITYQRHEFGIVEGFAADDRLAQRGIEPALEGTIIANSSIRPQFKVGEVSTDGANALKVVATTLDRIQVGNVQPAECMERQQRCHDFRRLRATSQAGFDRPVFFAPAFAGMDYHAVLEVDHGYQVEASHEVLLSMKILAYEHITGGGIPGDADLSVLAPEGEAMLRALLDDLTALSGVEVSVMRDARLGANLPARVHLVDNPADFQPAFRRAMHDADAVWPIAPEQDGILLRITDEILQSRRTLLGCRRDAVTVAASKRVTAEVLSSAGIVAVATCVDARDLPSDAANVVVKPDDGAGCQATRLFLGQPQLQAWLRMNSSTGLVFQPYVEGDARSLSLLCCEGRARVLACNRQKVGISGGVFAFSGVSVAAVADAEGRYALLADAIARALPGLWGYCGVDFIETDAGPVVLEVNPRMTTSYAGLRRATGINPAQLVLGLPGSLDIIGTIPRMQAVEVAVAHAV